MYDNNIKIKSYVSIIRCNKNNKKLNCIKKIKRKYSGNTFHVNTIVFCKNNMWNLKPKYIIEIFVAIFDHNNLTYNYLLKGKLVTYKKIIRVLLQFSFN